MSRNAKIFLVVAGSLALMCVCGCIAVFLVGGNLMQGVTAGADPDRARQIARQMFDYELPLGYSEQFGFDMFVYKMAMITKPGNKGMLFMAMQGNGLNRAQMEEQMRQSLGRQLGSRTGEMTLVSTEQVTIKGKPSTLGIYDGTYQQGGRMRQGMVAFDGKSGTVLLMAMASQPDWDRPVLDALLASIR